MMPVRPGEGEPTALDKTQPISIPDDLHQNARSPAAATARQPAVRRRGRQAAAALLVAVAALCLLLFFYAPRITVVVTPAVYIWDQTVAIPLEELPVAEVKTTVERTGAAPATGRRTLGVTPAKGEVVFTNKSTREIVVPAGTPISTGDGKEYVTLRRVEVPPARTEFDEQMLPSGIRYGMAKVEIQAAAPGTTGNAAARTLIKLPVGPAGLEVINPEPLTGGSDRVETFVTAADIARLEKELLSAFAAAGREELQKVVKDNGFLLPMDTVAGTPAVSAVPAAGQVAERVQVTVRGEVKGSYVPLAAVTRWLGENLEPDLPPDRELLGYPVVVALRWPEVPASVPEGSLLVDLQMPVAPRLDLEEIWPAVAGKAVAEARPALAALGAARAEFPPGVERLPNWKPWLKMVIAAPAATGAAFANMKTIELNGVMGATEAAGR